MARNHTMAPSRYNDPVFPSERFFREAWPAISQAMEPQADAARAVRWILGRVDLPPGARVLDAPCGFGRHSVEFARQGLDVTGVDFNETELGRAREAAARAGVKLTLLGQDMRDMEFAAEFDLAVNLFSSIGYFTDDEDRLLGVFDLDSPEPDRFDAEDQQGLEAIAAAFVESLR